MNIFLGAIIRHALTGVGSGLVANGLASNDQAQAITGGVTALVSVAMSLYSKWKNK